MSSCVLLGFPEGQNLETWNPFFRRRLVGQLLPSRRPMQPMDPPLLDPIWLEPYPDALLRSAYIDVAARYDRR